MNSKPSLGHPFLLFGRGYKCFDDCTLNSLPGITFINLDYLVPSETEICTVAVGEMIFPINA